MSEVTVARALARLLERMGTEVFFGLNGHGNWALLDALGHETRIRGVPARVEDQAVQMADGFWRMRRSAPLPVVTTSVRQVTESPSSNARPVRRSPLNWRAPARRNNQVIFGSASSASRTHRP